MAFCERAGKGKAKCLFFVHKKIIEEKLSKTSCWRSVNYMHLPICLVICPSIHLPSHLNSQPYTHTHRRSLILFSLLPTAHPSIHPPICPFTPPSSHTASQPDAYMLRPQSSYISASPHTLIHPSTYRVIHHFFFIRFPPSQLRPSSQLSICLQAHTRSSAHPSISFHASVNQPIFLCPFQLLLLTQSPIVSLAGMFFLLSAYQYAF